MCKRYAKSKMSENASNSGRFKEALLCAFLVVLAASALSAQSLSTGLAGYWRFNSDGKDSSGNGRDLTLIGNPTFAQGKFGQALSLDGSGNQYAIRDADDSTFDFGAGDFTVQIWVKFNTEPNEQTLIEKFTSTAGPGWTFTTPGGKTLQFYSTSNVVDEALSISTGTWYHFVARNNSGTLTLFVNGSPVASGNIGPVPASSNPLLIGRRNNGDTRIFGVNGLVEDAAIWTRALSDSEVSSLYQQELTVSSGTPASLTVLDDLTAASSGIVSYPDGASYCQTPTSIQMFTLASPAVYLYFDVNGAAVGDSPTANFYRPDGTLFQSYTWSPLTQVGTNGYMCFSDALNVSGASAASYPGVWTARVFWDQSPTPLFTLTFTIVNSNQPAPSINYRGVANAALIGASPSVAAGSIIEIYGTNLTSGKGGSAPTFPLPTTLFGSQVLMNSYPAALLFASPNQINAQAPWEIGGASTLSVQVLSGGVGSNISAISMADTGPGIFVIVHASDSSLITDANPAVPGEYLLIYCTGLGSVTNQPADGYAASANPLSRTIANTTVTIGGISAPVAFSGLAPGFAGLYQVNMQVPAGTPGGSDANLTLQAGSNTAATTISVQAAATPGIAVTVSPSTATVPTGDNQQFRANVTGATNPAVTWSVNGIPGGNSGVGTITSAGLYSAPAMVPNPATVTVTATSVQAPTASASATVNVTGPPSGGLPVITSLSNSTLNPLNILTITGSEFDSTATVGFSPVGSAMTIPVLPLVLSSTSLLVPVPPLFNGATSVSGLVNVTVQQSTGRSGSSQLQIQSLPPAPPSTPGTITVGFLEGIVATAMNLNSDPNNASLSPALSSVIAALNGMIQPLQSVVNGTAASANLGTFNGSSIVVGSSELTQIDRLLLALVGSLAENTEAGNNTSSARSQFRLSSRFSAIRPLPQAAASCSSAAAPTGESSSYQVLTSQTTTTDEVAFQVDYLNQATAALSPEALQFYLRIVALASAAIAAAPEGEVPVVLAVAAGIYNNASDVVAVRNLYRNGINSASDGMAALGTQLKVEEGLGNPVPKSAGPVLSVFSAGLALLEEIEKIPPNTNPPNSAAVACLSKTSLNFGTIPVETPSMAQSVTLTNNGTAPLIVSAVTPAGPSASDSMAFAPTQAPSCSTLQPNASCNISIVYTATANQPQSAAIAISDNAPDSPQVILVVGTGVPAICPDISHSSCGGGQQYTLTIGASGTGSGTVAPSPAGTSCGASCFSYSAGTAVAVTATPSSGSTFAGWSGACSGTGTCSVILNSNLTVTAIFTQPAPSGSETWKGTLSGTAGSGTCDSGTWSFNYQVVINFNSSLYAALQPNAIGITGSGSASGAETVQQQNPSSPPPNDCELLPSNVSTNLLQLAAVSGAISLGDANTNVDCTVTSETGQGCLPFALNLLPNSISSTVVSGVITNSGDNEQGTFILTKQ